MIPTLCHLKLKAGALQYTIFISVVIALLIFAFISLIYVQQRLAVKNSQFRDLIEATNQGFYAETLQDITYNKETVVPSISNAKSELSAIKQHWGFFDIAHLSGNLDKEHFTKAAFIGGHQIKRPALYIQDENQPLVLVGNTKIEGTAYVSKQGIKRGNIAGNAYTNNHLVYGNIMTSSKNLPAFLNLHSLTIMESELLSNDLNDFETLEDDMILVNSFSNPTKILTSTTSVDLRGVRLTGNIIIHATHKITICASSLLTDVILIAPNIEIGNNVKGNFQAIAKKNITIGKDCRLSYPTSLILLEKQQNITNDREEEHQISIAKGSSIKGIVAYISSSSKESYNTHIRIEEDATITGEVYCNQNIELKGTVQGSVYTRGFVSNQFGSVYKNHIYNGKILSSHLPTQYVGLQFKGTKLRTAKWLNY